MNDREKDKARSELQHALDALDDGAGRELWGPGYVGEALRERCPLAAFAFDCASMTAFSLLGMRTREQCIKSCRALAPVMLDLVLAEQPATEET